MSIHVAPPETDLVAVVQDFCARHEMSKTRFGELALNDPSFVTEIEAGREPRRRTVARVAAFIQARDVPQQGAA